MKSALLVIDVQHALFHTNHAPADADGVIERINALSRRARALNVPVIFIQHERAGSPLEFGSAGWQLDSRLDVHDADARLRKTTPDSFLGTELQRILSDVGVTHVVVCGYASEFCVDTTVRRAAGLGFDVTLARDAHTTHDKPHLSGAMISAHHNETLSSITSFAAKIRALPAESIWPN